MQKKVQEGILIRPADEYFISKEQSPIETENSLNENQSIEIKLVQQLLVQDGEEVESVEGIDLIKTYLNG